MFSVQLSAAFSMFAIMSLVCVGLALIMFDDDRLNTQIIGGFLILVSAFIVATTL